MNPGLLPIATEQSDHSLHCWFTCYFVHACGRQKTITDSTRTRFYKGSQIVVASKRNHRCYVKSVFFSSRKFRRLDGRGGGGLADNFLVINVTHIGVQLLRGLRTSISKDTYSHLRYSMGV